MTKDQVLYLWKEAKVRNDHNGLPEEDIALTFAELLLEQERKEIAKMFCPDCAQGNEPAKKKNYCVHTYPKAIPTTVMCRASGILARGLTDD